MDKLRYRDKRLIKVSKKNTRLRYSTRTKKNMGLIYKVWIAISFIIIQFIQPIWGEKGMVRIFKGMLQVSVSSAGVIQIDTNRYITRRNGWEQLDKLLKDKGYKTHVLFRQCEFWMNDGVKKKLKGRNIGEFFILWEGDEI